MAEEEERNKDYEEAKLSRYSAENFPKDF